MTLEEHSISDQRALEQQADEARDRLTEDLDALAAKREQIASEARTAVIVVAATAVPLAVTAALARSFVRARQRKRTRARVEVFSLGGLSAGFAYGIWQRRRMARLLAREAALAT